MPTPEEYRDSYLAGMQSTRTKDKYVKGIQSTSVNPMELAANANDLYVQRVQESVSSGRRTARLLSVPVSRWKANAAGEGANRLASGAKKADAKVLDHFRRFGPVYEQIRSEVRSMPKGTIDDALNRVRKSIELQKAAAGKS